ncbi:MAG: hypothetical protein PHT69_02855 [Bacteroidales bacterium]|nr:hypothetical protein [Bacteroidales bacterium]
MNKNATLLRKLNRLIILVVLFNIELFAYSQEYSSVLNSLDSAEAEHLQSLVEDLHPRIFVTQNNIQLLGGNNPTVAVCEVDAVNRLYENNPLYNEIEFLRIDIRNNSDLANTFSPTLMQSFSSLDYLLIFFQYDVCQDMSSSCLVPIVNQLLNNEQPQNINVIYRFEIIQ